jgi:serine/threonine-protein kinase
LTHPQKVGRYEIKGVLGRGTMGVVYEGFDAALGRSVALKAIDLSFAVDAATEAHFEQRFLSEARAAAGLQHPAIVVVYDIGRDDAGVLYMALEHLRGQTLDQLLAARLRLDWRRALELTRRVAEGLHHAHRNGVIHRDIKPANIMVLPSGEPKIMDFGIAKVSSEHLTAAGQTFGTASYMSPEQANGLALDARSDVFSLGAVLYETLTGTRAFPGTSVPAIMARIVGDEPAEPSSLVEGLPAGVDMLVAGALAKDPERRYPDATSLARDAGAVFDGGLPAFRPQRPTSGTAISPRDLAGPVGSVPVSPPFEDTAAHPGLALPPGKRISLAAIEGPCHGQVYGVTKPSVTLGRSGSRATADIKLGDPEVSREHAALHCDGSRFELEDLGSTNGTLVDGRRIQAQKLEDQSEFVIGRTRLMLIVTDKD